MLTDEEYNYYSDILKFNIDELSPKEFQYLVFIWNYKLHQIVEYERVYKETYLDTATKIEPFQRLVDNTKG